MGFPAFVVIPDSYHRIRKLGTIDQDAVHLTTSSVTTNHAVGSDVKLATLKPIQSNSTTTENPVLCRPYKTIDIYENTIKENINKKYGGGIMSLNAQGLG